MSWQHKVHSAADSPCLVFAPTTSMKRLAIRLPIFSLKPFHFLSFDFPSLNLPAFVTQPRSPISAQCEGRQNMHTRKGRTVTMNFILGAGEIPMFCRNRYRIAVPKPHRSASVCERGLGDAGVADGTSCSVARHVPRG